MEESFILRIKIKIYRIIHRIGLKNRDFTIVSNNCWGGYVYQEFGIKYNTPFIGLFIFSEDYIKLLQNFKYYLSQNLAFIKIDESKYYNEIKDMGIKKIYPIAMLDDIEIHFLHYKSQEEAQEKWRRRSKRINYNNILFKFSENYLCTEDLIKAFIDLNYKNKICFATKDYNDDHVIRLKEFEKEKKVVNEWSVSSNYVQNKQLLNLMYRD